MMRLFSVSIVVLGLGIFQTVCAFTNPPNSPSSFELVDLIAPQDTTGDPWLMHSLDPYPPSGSDGVKLGDVNYDGWPDLVCGFEEGGVTRIYINPGPEQAKGYWSYVELPSPDVEDAVLVDLDGDGMMDLVTASEGKDHEIRFHWAPEDPAHYMDSEKWETQIVPATSGLSAWMFVVPLNMSDRVGSDLIIGSKRKPGSGLDQGVLGWLECPADPRDIEAWKFHKISSAGWIMSIDPVDMDGDGLVDILISDRKDSSRPGIRWLQNPGWDSGRIYDKWKSHAVGMTGGEPMFLTRADVDQDGRDEILVPDLYQGLTILKPGADPFERWEEYVIPYPEWAGGRGKSVVCGDIDQDGQLDIVLSFEEEAHSASIPYVEYQKVGKYSVVWAKSIGQDGMGMNWTFKKVSGLKGRKFDLVTLIDLDGDGDLDVLTNDENEENVGLGVVWYENQVK